MADDLTDAVKTISTHSRAKAAGMMVLWARLQLVDFNSQPREGGWLKRVIRILFGFYFNSQPREGGWAAAHWSGSPHVYFNSQPREGGWILPAPSKKRWPLFQLTAARRRLGEVSERFEMAAAISTHSRAKAAGQAQRILASRKQISTHSRAKAAGTCKRCRKTIVYHFNSQPREGGWLCCSNCQA